MRPARGLFPCVVDPDVLDRAASATCRGKRRRPDVAWFLFERERRLAALHAALVDHTWRPSPPAWLTIRDPKPRLICRPTLEDRVVQRAIVDVLTPALEPGWMPEDMACRQGAGTHRAVLALQRAMRRHAWALHLDVRAYFPSIDVDRLAGLLASRIADRRMLALVDRILEAGRGAYTDPEVRRAAGLAPSWPPPDRGLPIGTSTSQLFAAHVYLQALDHRVKRVMKVPAYVRYVDDLFLFGRTRSELVAWRTEIARWLLEERGLRLKHPEARVLSCRGTLDGLGHRIRRDEVIPRPRRTRKVARAAARAMRGDLDALRRSTTASLGGPWL